MIDISTMSDNDLLSEIVDLVEEIQKLSWLNTNPQSTRMIDYASGLVAARRRAMQEKSMRLSILRTEALQRMASK